ncbi:MAG: hypothetical protein ACTMUB_06830 [cyanobacterium endosymbiont of Rhopalodia musculus]|uniref:hypothetical protein n=1 Tax=cyanobacterium endosymbiont of Epithemia clementina EcSB TaxID=3034674 RepID=UPI002480520B|nr:hypothetical protein [cyanobacterium endosymbiont of Epithemia clementina EcSB]WGT67821.1 hypothetical protein P3F56_01645 [cyanobacterium endosymbiont of Epithemia clementina EcSB]
MDIIDYQIGFMIKVLGLLIVLSIVIKYREERVAITPTTFNAIIGIAISPLLMVCALVWRLRNQPSIDPYIDKDSIR